MQWFQYIKQFMQQAPPVVFALIFGLISIVFFAPTIFFHQVPLPMDLVQDYLFDEPRVGENVWLRDTVIQIVPYDAFVFSEWKAGRIPNTHTFLFGQETSIQGTGQAAVWSPLNLFIPFFKTHLSFFAFKQVVTFWLTGFSLAVFLNSLGLRRLPALLGGLWFQWSGVMLAWFTWGIIDPAFAWMPLCLLTVQKITKQFAWHWLVIGMIGWWGMVTTGHFQFAAMATMTVILYALSLLIYRRKRLREWTKVQWIAASSVLLLLAILSILLVLPFIDIAPLSHRSGAVYTSPIFLGTFIQLMFPRIFGDPNTFAVTLNPIQSAASVGVAALVIILYRFMWIERHVRRQELFWIGLSGALTALMITPKILWPLHHFFSGLYNYPFSRFIVFVSLALAILGATSLDAIMRSRAQHKTVLLRRGLLTLIPFVIIVGVLIVGFSNRLFHDFYSHQLPVFSVVLLVTLGSIVFFQSQARQLQWAVWIVAVVLVIIVITEQWIGYHVMVPQQSRDAYTTIPAHIQFLQAQRTPDAGVRVYSEISPVNLYMYYGIESLFGYDSNFPEAVYREYKREGKVISHQNIINAKFQPSDLSYLHSKNVDYIVTRRDWPLPLVHESDGVRIYQLVTE